MPEHTTLLTVTTENILTITLNRPESYEAMKKGQNDALKQAEKDEGVW
jgi:enoyl-CoA hydratase/carnithine racemase